MIVEVDKLLAIRSATHAAHPVLRVAEMISIWAQNVVEEVVADKVSIDPELIAARVGITIERGDLEATFGLAVHTAKTKKIVIREGMPEWATRFVCAHELAHHILFFPDDPLAPTSVRWASNGKIAGDIEKICDIFALALLLPAREFAAQLGAGREVSDLYRVASLFGVPLQLVIERLWHLNEWLQVSATVADVMTWDDHLAGAVVTAVPVYTSDQERLPPGRPIRVLIRNANLLRDQKLNPTIQVRAETLNGLSGTYWFAAMTTEKERVCLIRQ